MDAIKFFLVTLNLNMASTWRRSFNGSNQ